MIQLKKNETNSNKINNYKYNNNNKNNTDNNNIIVIIMLKTLNSSSLSLRELFFNFT